MLCHAALEVHVLRVHYINSLPNDKILGVTKLKAFTDDKSKVAKMRISLFD